MVLPQARRPTPQLTHTHVCTGVFVVTWQDVLKNVYSMCVRTVGLLVLSFWKAESRRMAEI